MLHFIDRVSAAQKGQAEPTSLSTASLKYPDYFPVFFTVSVDRSHITILASINYLSLPAHIAANEQ